MIVEAGLRGIVPTGLATVEAGLLGIMPAGLIIVEAGLRGIMPTGLAIVEAGLLGVVPAGLAMAEAGLRGVEADPASLESAANAVNAQEAANAAAPKEIACFFIGSSPFEAPRTSAKGPRLHAARELLTADIGRPWTRGSSL